MFTTIKRMAKESIDVLPFPLDSLICSLIDYRGDTPALRAGQQSALRTYRQLGCDMHVVSGPFTGMQYFTNVPGGAWLPKLLGTYEMELAPAVDECISWGFETIVDIGAAEGYYAVGMARRNPQARVIAFEFYPPARQLLLRLARINGVRRQMTIYAECTIDRLNAALATGSSPKLVISDCEGAEDQLLDPVRVPALRQATLLVEMHDNFCPGVTDRLQQRFAATHDIQLIPARERTLDDFPLDRNRVPTEDALAAMNEAKESDMKWLYCKPRAAD
jgi:hypothetical protein